MKTLCLVARPDGKVRPRVNVLGAALFLAGAPIFPFVAACARASLVRFFVGSHGRTELPSGSVGNAAAVLTCWGRTFPGRCSRFSRYSPAMSDAEPHILVEKRGALGLVTLNRPKALNALTHGMCIGLHKALDAWADDADIRAVVVRGAGPRAFCAGGDIRALWESGRDKTRYAGDFLRDEYRLNNAIANYTKPYVALLHGIVM